LIAVSGASGFIGSQIAKSAATQKHLCRLLMSGASATLSGEHEMRTVGRFDGRPIDPVVLSDCSTVIHAAARAHVMRETVGDVLASYRLVNTASTIRLAEAAIAAGVRRFVFVSSIGVLGNCSTGSPLEPERARAPIEPYAISKAEAEIALTDLVQHGEMDLVIVRPPLVHGPGAKGNFHRLLEGIANERPLPLGGVHNRRSFIGVSNLAEALIKAATAPFSDFFSSGEKKSAAIYHVADNGIISTRRLVEVLADGMGVKPRLINLPRWLAVGGATLLGKGAMARRLFDDLEVDASAFTKDTGWQPKKSLEDGLREMAAAYAQQHRVGRFG
jgi:nucleoside-diphosphate-sugar epimerase